MKKVLFIFTFALLATSLFSQEEEQWVNKISFVLTDDCPDSVTCYTEIFMEINLEVVPDSATMKVRIGTTNEEENIYSKKYTLSPEFFTKTEVSQDSIGNPVISLGKYLDTEGYFVDLKLEEKKQKKDKKDK